MMTRCFGRVALVCLLMAVLNGRSALAESDSSSSPSRSPLAALCAAIPTCSVFDLEVDPPVSCGCHAAVARGCHWCLEAGSAFAPDEAASSSCLAPVATPAHCPAPAAQAIRECTVMDGTSFGWCAVRSVGDARGSGYAVEGNPSSPAVGARKCHHWVWTASACRPDWTTGAPRDSKHPPPAEVCAVVPPCAEVATAGGSLCGCQASTGLGCAWCLEQGRAVSIANASTASCRALITHPSHCPSQQAQTVRTCVGVGGLPFGWCAVDEVEPNMGFSLDGTSHGPSTNPKQCRAWYFHSAECPDARAAAAAAARDAAEEEITLLVSSSSDDDTPTPDTDNTDSSASHSVGHMSELDADALTLVLLLGLSGSALCAAGVVCRGRRPPRSEYEEIASEPAASTFAHPDLAA